MLKYRARKKAALQLVLTFLALVILTICIYSLQSSYAIDFHVFLQCSALSAFYAAAAHPEGQNPSLLMIKSSASAKTEVL